MRVGCPFGRKLANMIMTSFTGDVAMTDISSQEGCVKPYVLREFMHFLDGLTTRNTKPYIEPILKAIFETHLVMPDGFVLARDASRFNRLPSGVDFTLDLNTFNTSLLHFAYCMENKLPYKVSTQFHLGDDSLVPRYDDANSFLSYCYSHGYLLKYKSDSKENAEWVGKRFIKSTYGGRLTRERACWLPVSSRPVKLISKVNFSGVTGETADQVCLGVLGALYGNASEYRSLSDYVRNVRELEPPSPLFHSDVLYSN